MNWLRSLPLLLSAIAFVCQAGEELVESAATAAPKYVVILFPGGNGIERETITAIKEWIALDPRAP